MGDKRVRATVGASALAMCCGLAFLSNAPRAVVGVYQRPLLSAFDWVEAWSDNWQLAQAATIAIAAPFVGALIDRFGFARVACACALLTAGGLAGLTLSSQPAALFLAAGLMCGVGLAGLAVPLALAPLAGGNPALAGLIAAASGLGALVLTPLAFALVPAAGWTTTLGLFAALMLIGAGWSAATPQAPAKNLGVSDIHPARRAEIASLLAQVFLSGLVLAFAAQRFQKFAFDAELSANNGAIALLLLCAANVAGALAAGFLTARAGAQSTIGLLAMLRAVLAIALVATPPGLVATFAGALLLGAAWLSIWPAAAARLVDLCDASHRGRALGLAASAWQIGGVIGGLLHFAAGATRPAWYALALLTLVAVIPAFGLPRRNSLHIQR